MSDWDDYVRQTKITFQTPAPADAPEVKGYRCYFRPEWLEWHVSPNDVQVAAFGSATRTSSFPGEMRWSVEGRHGDERPSWLLLPADLLAHANLAVERLEELRKAAS